MEEARQTIKIALVHFYTDQAYSFSASYMNCRSHLSQRAIHDLRLSLKNLNALAEMLMALDPSRRARKFEMPPKLGKLFNQLGAIRDIQNLEAELKRQEKKLKTGFGKFRKHFKNEKQAAVKKLAPVLIGLKFGPELLKLRQYMEAVLLKYGDEEVLKKKILGYVEKSWVRIRRMLKERHTERNLHAIRISLKHLYYILAVIKSEKAVTESFPFRIDLLDPFQELLGRWHDTTIFRKKLRDFKSGKGKRQTNLVKVYFLEGMIGKEQSRLKRRISRQSVILLAGNGSADLSSKGIKNPGGVHDRARVQ